MSFIDDLANIFYACAFSARDVLMLRIFAGAGGLIMLPYYYLQPVPLMVPIYWGSAFIALNLFWIVRLLLERRPVKFSEEELRLYRLVFRTLKPREMLELLKLAKWKDRDTGATLEKAGEPQDRLSVIVSGRGAVRLPDRQVSEVGAGQFVGEMSFMTDEVAPVSVHALEPVRQVSWHKDELRDFLKSKPDLSAALELILGADLSAMLEAAWKPAAVNGSSS